MVIMSETSANTTSDTICNTSDSTIPDPFDWICMFRNEIYDIVDKQLLNRFRISMWKKELFTKRIKTRFGPKKHTSKHIMIPPKRNYKCQESRRR